jgi:hypothetical protein
VLTSRDRPREHGGQVRPNGSIVIAPPTPSMPVGPCRPRGGARTTIWCPVPSMFKARRAQILPRRCIRLAATSTLHARRDGRLPRLARQSGSHDPHQDRTFYAAATCGQWTARAAGGRPVTIPPPPAGGPCVLLVALRLRTVTGGITGRFVGIRALTRGITGRFVGVRALTRGIASAICTSAFAGAWSRPDGARRPGVGGEARGRRDRCRRLPGTPRTRQAHEPR